MLANQNGIKLPDGFLTGLRESYKYFFFKTLIELACDESSNRFSEICAISHMVSEAWPFALEGTILLGNFDRLQLMCSQVAKDISSNETPPVELIMSIIARDSYAEDKMDISRVFDRFSDAWFGSGRNSVFLMHSQELTSRRGFLYHLETIDGISYICINDEWRKYCLESRDRLIGLYADQLHLFLIKRNRGNKRVRPIIDSKILGIGKNNQSTTERLCVNTVRCVAGVADDNFAIFEQMPVDFLYREPKIIERSAGTMYLKDEPQDDISTVADLLCASTFKRKRLIQFQEYIIREQDRLVSAYHYYNDVPMIPRDVQNGIPLGISTREFISEYIDRLSDRNSFLIPKESERRTVRLKVFSALYDGRLIDETSINSLAKELGLHPERVRQLQKGEENTVGIEACSQILNGYTLSEDFILNPQFQSDYLELASSGLLADRQEDFDSRFGIVDDKTRDFLMATLGLHLADSIRYIEPFIIKGENISAINRAFAKVMNFFNDEAVFLSLESSLVPFLKQEVGLEYNVIDIILEIVKHSCLFESEVNEEGEELFALKWQYLLTTPSRLARILFDVGEPMYHKDLYEEYNRRAVEYGQFDSIDFSKFIKRIHPYIKTKGKTGIWYFSKEDESAIKQEIPLLIAIDKYIVSEGGIVNSKQVIDYARKMGYTQSERSIRTYLSQLCRMVKNEQDKYVYRDWCDRFPELEFYEAKTNDFASIMPIVIKTLLSI